MTLGRAGPEFGRWDDVRAVLAEAFSDMEGRIDPPSSLHGMDAGDLARMAETGTAVVASDGSAIVGCGFGEVKTGGFYLSKLAVLPAFRGRGILRRMVDALSADARRRGLDHLWLQSRVELTETHAAFQALGFHKTAETRHPGFDRTTSLVFRRDI